MVYLISFYNLIACRISFFIFGTIQHFILSVFTRTLTCALLGLQ